MTDRSSFTKTCSAMIGVLVLVLGFFAGAVARMIFLMLMAQLKVKKIPEDILRKIWLDTGGFD